MRLSGSGLMCTSAKKRCQNALNDVYEAVGRAGCRDRAVRFTHPPPSPLVIEVSNADENESARAPFSALFPGRDGDAGAELHSAGTALEVLDREWRAPLEALVAGASIAREFPSGCQ